MKPYTKCLVMPSHLPTESRIEWYLGGCLCDWTGLRKSVPVSTWPRAVIKRPMAPSRVEITHQQIIQSKTNYVTYPSYPIFFQRLNHYPLVELFSG